MQVKLSRMNVAAGVLVAAFFLTGCSEGNENEGVVHHCDEATFAKQNRHVVIALDDIFEKLDSRSVSARSYNHSAYVIEITQNLINHCPNDIEALNKADEILKGFKPYLEKLKGHEQRQSFRNNPPERNFSVFYNELKEELAALQAKAISDPVPAPAPKTS